MHRGLKPTLIPILVLWFLFFGISPVWGSVWEEINQANTLYQNNQFKDAAQQYEKLITEEIDNGYLYYNLGNAYYRQGQYGQAILNFLRAKFLLPRDETVEANLLFAIQETQDKLDWEREGVSRSFFFWIEDVTLQEHLKWLVGINLVFWILQGAVLVWPTWGTSVARSLGLGLLMLTLFSTGLRWHYDSNWNYGVVLAQRVEVYSGTGADKSLLFHLHEGAIVTLSGQSDEWKQVVVPDGKKGWVWAPEKELGTIS